MRKRNLVPRFSYDRGLIRTRCDVDRRPGSGSNVEWCRHEKGGPVAATDPPRLVNHYFPVLSRVSLWTDMFLESY